MPTYQYACTNPDCGNRFELVQSFTDPSASECPVCGSPVRKVFSAVGVVFKGSGFYRNDSRAGSGSGSSKESSSDSSSTPAKAESSSGTANGSSSSGSTSGATKSGGSSGGGAKESSSGGSGTASKSAAPA